MELASYLHRRVQEIGKQFFHHPFRINTNEKGESLPAFLQARASALPLGPSTANFRQKACDPAQLGALHKTTENCLHREERAPSLAEENRSSEPRCTGAFLPGLSRCTEMEECTTANLYDNFFNKEMKGCMRTHLQDSRPDDARTCNRVHLFQQKGEDARGVSLLDREEKIPFYAEKPPGFACCAPPFPEVAIVRSTQSGVEFPLFSENVTSSVCGAPWLPSKGEGMCDASPTRAADVDAANCPAVLCTEGRSPIRPMLCTNHAPRPLCDSVSGLNNSENLSLALRLPSLQDHHLTSDAENARVLPRMRKGERDNGNPEHSPSCVVVSQKPCHDGLLEIGKGNAVLQEPARKQVSMHTQSTHSCAVSESHPSRAVAENPSSPYSLVLRSVSSVDSSECDNCGSDAVVTDRAGSRNSEGASGNKSEEIDAVSEAQCLGTHRKEDDDDDDDGTIVVAVGGNTLPKREIKNATIVVAVGGDTLPKQEIKNYALDLLLDAIQVTSGGVLAEKQDADACRPPSLKRTKHVLARKGDESLHERMESSSGKVFKRTKKAPAVNGQSCLPERVNGSERLIATSSHGIQDDTHKRNSPDLRSKIGSSPVGRFPIVRKRSHRCSKTVVKEEPSGNSLPTAVRFKSLQAVSEVTYFKKGKVGKESVANKQEQGTKVPSLKMQEREKTKHRLIQSSLNGKREKDWEEKQKSAEKEDQSSKQEKRARLADTDDLQEGRGKGGQMPPIPAEGGEIKDEEEQAVMSRRARSQVLPNKFLDSVLQPWKKRERRKS